MPGCLLRITVQQFMMVVFVVGMAFGILSCVESSRSECP
jgi:hypothetical protein